MLRAENKTSAILVIKEKQHSNTNARRTGENLWLKNLVILIINETEIHGVI